jgi:predicted nucleic acid-binding protein
VTSGYFDQFTLATARGGSRSNAGAGADAAAGAAAGRLASRDSHATIVAQHATPIVIDWRRSLVMTGWGIRDIDADIAVLAARLRLRHALKLPHAFQLAVALEEGCAAVVTHDRGFDTVTDILVLGTARRAR